MKCKRCVAELKLNIQRTGFDLYSFDCNTCGRRTLSEISQALVQACVYSTFEYARADITWDKYIRDYLKELKGYEVQKM